MTNCDCSIYTNETNTKQLRQSRQRKHYVRPSTIDTNQTSLPVRWYVLSCQHYGAPSASTTDHDIYLSQSGRQCCRNRRTSSFQRTTQVDNLTSYQMSRRRRNASCKHVHIPLPKPPSHALNSSRRASLPTAFLIVEDEVCR